MAELPNQPSQATDAVRSVLHGIPVTTLVSPDGARVIVADHGAHVLSWQPAGGDEVLYLSPTSSYGAGQAIRGGVPVIFPQFGERGPGRRHGVARLQSWRFCGAQREGADVSAQWQLSGLLDATTSPARALMADAGARPDVTVPAAAFRLTLTVRFSGVGLLLDLQIDNRGSQPWQAHAALHTYFKVADLAQTRVDGLQQVPFIDNALPLAADALAAGEPASVGFAGEVDRLYANVPSKIVLQTGAQPVSVTQSGFTEAVLWNPGAEKGASLSDLTPGGQAGFVCIEAVRVLEPVALAPGASWRGWQLLQAGLA